MHVPSAMPCPQCRCEVVTPYLTYRDFSYLQCHDCRLVFSDKLYTQRGAVYEAQDAVYDQDAYAERSVLSDVLQTIETDRLRRLQRYVAGGRLLEIGCATGEFLRVAQRDFDVVGIEPSPSFAAAHADQPTIHHCRVEDFTEPPGSFDAVVMYHVFEHIQAHGPLVAQMAALLKPGGIAYVVVPNLKALTNRLLPKYHPDLTQPDHLYQFTPESLQRAFAGFDVVAVSTREYPHHLFTTLRALAAALKRRLRTGQWEPAPGQGAAPSGRVAAKSVLRVRLPYLLAWLFRPVLLPYFWSVERLGLGEEIHLVLRKPAAA